MVEAGVDPDTRSFNELLAACCAANDDVGRVAEAESIMSQLCEFHVRPNEVTCGTLMRAYAMSGMMKECEDTLASMNLADSRSYSTLGNTHT